MKMPTPKAKELYKKEREALVIFVQEPSPARVSRTLRKLLLDYLAAYKDGLPVDFELWLFDLDLLFSFLDHLEEAKKEF